MSHFTELKVNSKVEHEDCLIEALKEVFGGGAVEVSDKPITLTGYDRNANKKAHIVVRKGDIAKVNKAKHAYNDLGYERMPDGTYTFHADNLDIPQNLQYDIFVGYASRVASKTMGYQGYTMKTTKTAKGEVQLELTKC